MLNIKERIDVIESLLKEDTQQSLTYAALECRLTIEYLCYERFKRFYSYISPDDLMNWQPKHVVKQISEDVDDFIRQGFTLYISPPQKDCEPPKTKKEYEALEYTLLGKQSELNLNKLHNLWHGLANVALHIPVPNIHSGELKIYGNRESMKTKVIDAIEYFRTINGNLLIGGTLNEVFTFNCHACNTLLKRPIDKLSSIKIINCLNPKCDESYLVTPESKGEGFTITRRVFKFSCDNCGEDIVVPTNIFSKLKFNQQINIICFSCSNPLHVVMRPQKVLL